MNETASNPPTAFISYSWDSEDHKSWIREFAARLRGDGIDVKLDRWETVPGDQLPRFMETAIRENQYVLVVCTPNYKLKSDKRKGGVGYEGDIMTSEVFTTQNHRKFIPVLRAGSWTDSMPTWMGSKYGIDVCGDPYSEVQYHDLLLTLHDQREQAPPMGNFVKRSMPLREAVKQFLPTKEGVEGDFEPVRIEGIIVDEVGEPRNDGTRGSALYPVPFKLSRAPSHEWCDLFIRTWDNPSRWTTQHRPGIARVERDRIILNGTTMDEI